MKGAAIVTGQIISLSPCVGSVARIMTRFLFLVVNSARSWRELKAVCLALEAFASHFSGVKVIWYSGNQNVQSILQNGSREADMLVCILSYPTIRGAAK